MKRLLRVDWDVVAGILAAVAALVMHLLHIIEAEVLLAIAVFLIALLFLRDLRRERASERIEESLQHTEAGVREILGQLTTPEVVLVGPRQLRRVSESFSLRARGEMVWFHVCLSMFRPQALFDLLLRPAIENPHVSSILFVLDREQQSMWTEQVEPKIAACRGHDKVLRPHWTTITENVSLVLSDVGSHDQTECLLSFWGEPFMARTASTDVPRYIFHVQSHSELLGRLVDVVRSHRMG